MEKVIPSQGTADAIIRTIVSAEWVNEEPTGYLLSMAYKCVA